VRLRASDVSRRFTRRASLAVLTVVPLIPIGGCSSNDADSSAAPSESSAPSETSTPSKTSATSVTSTTATTTPPARTDGGTSTSTPADISADDEFEELERRYDARLGVYAVETGMEQEIEYRADERFGHASTFKAPRPIPPARDSQSKH